MFPSSGLFAEIVCPLSSRGLCERPHCFYKHATGVGDMFGASHKTSILDFAGRCFDDYSSATNSGSLCPFFLVVSYTFSAAHNFSNFRVKWLKLGFHDFKMDLEPK